MHKARGEQGLEAALRLIHQLRQGDGGKADNEAAQCENRATLPALGKDSQTPQMPGDDAILLPDRAVAKEPEARHKGACRRGRAL
jgi:hypothetical protein